MYQPFVSSSKNKKYSVYVKSVSGTKKLVHFGDTRYGQYKDKLGYYSSRDHLDQKRRKAYYSRHEDTDQQLTRTHPSIGLTKFYGKNKLKKRLSHRSHSFIFWGLEVLWFWFQIPTTWKNENMTTMTLSWRRDHEIRGKYNTLFTNLVHIALTM